MNKITTSWLRHLGAALLLPLAAIGGCSTVSQWKVLTEASFDNIRPGMSSDEVLAQLGPPTTMFGAGWAEHTKIWNYRWTGADCIWYQITIRDADRRVREAGIGQDPRCDGPNSRD
jgi:hypothetical protein